eukprot:403335245
MFKTGQTKISPPINQGLDIQDFDEYQHEVKLEIRQPYTEQQVKDWQRKYKLNLKHIQEQGNHISEFQVTKHHINQSKGRYANSQNPNHQNESQQINEIIHQTYDDFFKQNSVQTFMNDQNLLTNSFGISQPLYQINYQHFNPDKQNNVLRTYKSVSQLKTKTQVQSPVSSKYEQLLFQKSTSLKNFVNINKDVKLLIAQRNAKRLRKALDEEKSLWVNME